MGKQITGYGMSTSFKPTAVLCYVFILVQIRGRSHVCGESIYVPNVSINPDVLHFLHTRPGQAINFNIPQGREVSRDAGTKDAAKEGIDSYMKLGSQRPDYVYPDLNGGQQNFNSRSGEIGEADTQYQHQQDTGYGEQQQQLQQLPPTGFLFAKQFPQSSNPKIFNQPNGLLMDKEASMESEKNGRLGLLSGFNEFNLPSKQVVIRSRPSRYQVLGPPSTSKRNSAVGRDGYMCHFKLCQLGASGKRRWSPLFEND